MSETKFTPGPWAWKPESETKSKTPDFDCLVSGKLTVLNGYWHNDRTAGVGVSVADARLIAAAPDLYQVLERVQAIYRQHSARMAPLIAGDDQMEPLMVEVSAALAKADGK